VQIANTATSRSGINFNLAGTRSLALQVFGFRCRERGAQLDWRVPAGKRHLLPRFSRVFLIGCSSSRRVHGMCLPRVTPARFRRAAATLSTSSRRCIVQILRSELYDGRKEEGGGVQFERINLWLNKRTQARHNLLDERVNNQPFALRQ